MKFRKFRKMQQKKFMPFFTSDFALFVFSKNSMYDKIFPKYRRSENAHKFIFLGEDNGKFKFTKNH